MGRNKREFFRNIALLLAAILVAFALLELGLRLFHPQLTLDRAEKLSPKSYDKSDYTPWKLKQNSNERMTSPYGEFDITFTINPLGLREKEFSLKKEKNTTRLVFIGDSFTFGVGVKLEDTYSKKLELLLNKNHKNKYEAINMGFADGSYTTDIQYLALKEKALKFNPDIVFIGLFVGNDISDLNRNSWVKNDSRKLPLNITSGYHYVDSQNRLRVYYENKSYYEKYRTFGIANYYLSKKLHLFVLVKNFLIRKTYQPEKIFLEAPPDNVMENIEKIKLILKEMKKISNDSNAGFVVILIPSKTQVWDSEWQLYQDTYKDMRPSRSMPQDLFMDFCRSNNLTCINLLPEFLEKADKNNFYYPIDGHWDEKGHQLAAETIYLSLVKEGILQD